MDVLTERCAILVSRKQEEGSQIGPLSLFQDLDWPV